MLPDNATLYPRYVTPDTFNCALQQAIQHKDGRMQVRRGGTRCSIFHHNLSLGYRLLGLFR